MTALFPHCIMLVEVVLRRESNLHAVVFVGHSSRGFPTPGSMIAYGYALRVKSTPSHAYTQMSSQTEQDCVAQ